MYRDVDLVDRVACDVVERLVHAGHQRLDGVRLVAVRFEYAGTFHAVPRDQREIRVRCLDRLVGTAVDVQSANLEIFGEYEYTRGCSSCTR